MSAVSFQVYGIATVRAGKISVMAQAYTQDRQAQRVESEVALPDIPDGERLYLFSATLKPTRQVFVQAVSAEQDAFINDRRLRKAITDAIKKVERLVK